MISLEDEVQPNLIDLGVTNPPTVGPDVATTRATKASFGTNVPFEDAFTAIIGGKEEVLRNQIAAQQRANNATTIADFVATRQSPLTPEEINDKFNKPVSPDSVFEQNYAKQYMSHLYMAPGHEIVDDNGTWSEAVRTIPDHVRKATDIGAQMVTLREVLKKGQEDAQAALEAQGWGPYAVDTLKSLTQIYPELELRNNVPGANFSVGLGSALENQRVALWSDIPSAISNYPAIIKKLIDNNPQMAVQFASAMLGQSDDEKFINNIFTAMAPLDVFGAGKTVKEIIQAQRLAHFTNVAAAHMVTAAPNAEITTVRRAAADAAGDNAVSGQRGFTDHLLDLKGTNEVQESLNGLVSALNADKTQATSRPGNYGADVMNRLRESYELAADKITNAITTLARIDRLGQASATEKFVKGAWQQIKDNYRGLNNNTVQINLPRKNPISGEWSVDQILGRDSGEFFSDFEEAHAWAVLNNMPISHYGDIKVGAGAQANTTFGEAIKSVAPTTGAKDMGANASLASLLNVGQGVATKKLGKYTAYRPAGPKTGATIRELKLSNAPDNMVAPGQVGKKFYIAINRPISETNDFIRDQLVETVNAKSSNKGWLNSLGLPAWIRTPNEVLSKQENLDRITSIYAAGAMKKIIADITSDVSKARNRGKGLDVFTKFGRGSQFEAFLNYGLKKVDPETGKPGYEWKNPQDMSEAFHQAIGRVPDPIEVHAYFAYQQGLALDYSFRNLALYRNMRRVGAETHTLSAMVDGNKVSSSPFAGVVHDSMPGGNDPILIMDDQGQKVYRTGSVMNALRGRKGAEGLAKGEYKLIELYNRDLRPLRGFNNIGDDNIRYVLTNKAVATRPLEFQQLPRQMGGHHVYDADHYIKQAIVSSTQTTRKSAIERGAEAVMHRYEGDATVMPIDNRALGSDIVDKLNNVRLGFKNGDLEAAKAAARGLPIPFEDLHSWFYPKKGPDGVTVPARLDWNQPFYVVPKNKTIKDIPNHLDFNNVQDGTTTGSLARQFQVEFTGERDAQDVFTIKDAGTRQNPLYSYEPAALLDPITVLNRALTRVVDSLWMDDYKIASMERWLQDAIKIGAFKESTDEVRGAPWHYFMNGKLRTGLTEETKQLLEAKRWQIKAFNGVPSTMDAWVHGVQQTLADSIYAGENPLIRTGALLAKHALAATYNAPSFLRSVAYRMDIGLFSIPQFIVQSQNFASIFAIGGYKAASQGTVAGLLHQYSRINSNPQILQALDRIAQRFGWAPGQWMQARELLSKTGFDLVSKETNQLMSHYHMSNNFVKSSWGTAMDVGEMPFKAGERNARYGAWYTSVKNHLDLNPAGAITNDDLQNILLRADNMAGNMSKASRSALQAGPLAFTSQFLGYQLRLIEQFTGKRLTGLEKARMFGTYAMLYGVPVASSAVLLGLPADQTTRKYLLESGYVNGQSAVAEGFLNGIPEAIMRMVTGNSYNVPERFGPGGFDLYRDMLAGDKSFLTVLAGPTGAVATAAYEAMDPMFAWIASHLRGDGTYKITAADMLNVARISAAGNNFIRLGDAIRTGNWSTRNENVIKEGVNPLEAIWMTGTGLQPMAGTDVRVIKDAEEDQKARDQNTSNLFIKSIRRGMQAVKDQDTDNANAYFNNAFATLEFYAFPKDRRDTLFAQAFSKETLPERVKWQFYLGRDVPAGQEQLRADAFAKLHELEGQ